MSNDECLIRAGHWTKMSNDECLIRAGHWTKIATITFSEMINRLGRRSIGQYMTSCKRTMNLRGIHKLFWVCKPWIQFQICKTQPRHRRWGRIISQFVNFEIGWKKCFFLNDYEACMQSLISSKGRQQAAGRCSKPSSSLPGRGALLL